MSHQQPNLTTKPITLTKHSLIQRDRQHRNTWEPWAYWGFWVQICYKQPQGKYLSNETVLFQAEESSDPKLQATCTIASTRDHVNQTSGLTLLETLQ